MKAIVVCGFPGIGKSYACANTEKYDLLDLDSSLFTKDPAWEFPEDYIKALDDVVGWEGEPDFIFMSAHAETRNELAKNNIPYVNAYPDAARKAEIVTRIAEREAEKEYGNPQLASIVEDNYDTWVKELDGDTDSVGNYALSRGQHLSDILDKIKMEVIYMKMHEDIEKAFDMFRQEAQLVAEVADAPEDYTIEEQDEALDSLETAVRGAGKKYNISYRHLNEALDLQHEYTLPYLRRTVGSSGYVGGSGYFHDR